MTLHWDRTRSSQTNFNFKVNVNLKVLDNENKDIYWSESYVKSTEPKFEVAFQTIYEKNFIEDIYPQYQSTISLQELINAVEKKSNWDNFVGNDEE